VGSLKRFQVPEDSEKEEYVKYFFNEICDLEVYSVSDSTTALDECDNIAFSVVMDRLERMTSRHGRLSHRIWRNVLFLFDSSLPSRDVVDADVAEIKKLLPSIFIRSFVYLVYIERSAEALPGVGKAKPDRNAFRIYHWNTKYEVERCGKQSLFGEIKTKKGIDKVVLTKNPAVELDKIRQANLDIIDCVRSFNNELPLVPQTENYLEGIVATLKEEKDSRILVQGPARSGKTILAMSLLHAFPKSKMLLMNWYFYKALQDGFSALSSFSKEEIVDLFDLRDYPKFERNSDFFKYIQSNIWMLEEGWNEHFSSGIGRWKEVKNARVDIEQGSELLSVPDYKEKYIVVIGKDVNEGDTILVYRQSGKIIQLGEVTDVVQKIKISTNGRGHKVYSAVKFNSAKETKLKVYENVYLDLLGKGKGRDEYLAEKIKEISRELEKKGSGRFYHHSLLNPEGLWIERGDPTTSVFKNESLIICDEVQRLGVIPKLGQYDEFDEIECILNNSRQSFFCGDDQQMLNPLYDRGIAEVERRLQRGKHSLFKKEIPKSVGLPPQAKEIIMVLLSEANLYEGEDAGFNFTFIHSNPKKLVDEFRFDRSTKKHYAIPMNSTFSKNAPIISDEIETVDKFNNEEHKRLLEKFPFFTNTQIMPSYAFSAYELISREVESIYLHVPSYISVEDVLLSIHEDNWKKRHLYVLMTRATLNLVVNVESLQLFEYFKNTAKVRGLESAVRFIC